MNELSNSNSAFYAIVGFLIVSNLGAIVGFIRVLIKRETEIALIQHTLESIRLQLADIKFFQEKATKDIHEAHTKIREVKATLPNRKGVEDEA